MPWQGIEDQSTLRQTSQRAVTEPKGYKDTVNLPQTDFNMRANAVQREPELQKFWAEKQIYENLSHNNPGDRFILHDGPPYANGILHMGHALNKTLKDIINKYKLLRGYKVRYVPGWDCHGLPIELKVLQSLKSNEREGLTPLKLRHKARDFAIKTQQEQAIGFQRYGVWGYREQYQQLFGTSSQIEIGDSLFLKLPSRHPLQRIWKTARLISHQFGKSYKPCSNAMISFWSKP